MLFYNSKYKIKKKSEIQFLLRNCIRIKENSFNIFYKTNEENHDRFCVLVSRKVGNAVTRNKIKRTCREVFRKEIRRNPPFLDILIQIRPGIKIKNNIEYEICLREWIKESKTNL